MDWSPLWISLKVALTATVLVVLIGMPIAYVLGKYRFPLRSLAEGVANLPLVMPPTVMGYFLLVLLGNEGPIGRFCQAVFHQTLVFTWHGAAIAAAVTSMPLLITQARVAFAAIDRDIEDSARVFGANEIQTFFRITLPLARPGVIAGVTLAFARAIGDFGATLMVAGDIPDRTQTMPLAIYDALQIGDDRTLMTFVVISSLLTLVFTLLASRLAAK